MNKFLLYLFLLTSFVTLAGLPPTTTKINGDATKKTTFDFEFPSFTGTHTGTKVAITGGTDFTFSGDVTLSGSQFSNTKIGQSLAQNQSTGLDAGGVLTIDADPTKFDLSAQKLSFSNYTVDSNLPQIRKVDCPALNAQTVTNLATADSTYILIDSSCVVTQLTTAPTPTQRREKAFIGRLGHANRTAVTAAAMTPNFVIDPTSQLYDVIDAIGAFNISGNVISANGANLSINRSAGKLFRRGSNYVTNDQDPHGIITSSVTAGSFLKSTVNATSAAVTVIDPANYDVAGTVTTIPGGGGVSTNRRVYLFSTGTMAIQYGQVTYTSLANAVSGIANEAFIINPNLAEGGVLIAVISCRKDATLLNNTAQCVISKVSRFDSTGVSVGSNTVATLQSSYDNSVTPQITTSTALGSVDLKRGSAADTDNVLRIQNGAGVSKVDIKGDGSTRIEAPVSAYNLARDNNLLVNGSFENITYNDGWTCSLGSTTLETTAKTDGNKANAINSIGAGVRCYQTSTTNAANLKGLLGSAILKVKTTDSIYKVCGLVDGNAAADERNCITVNPTSTNLPFYPARTDFYMGGTSNGIVVYTTTTTSQPTVIDDAFVGVFNGGLSQFSNNTGWSDCGLTAADFAGFGTPTAIQLQCKRDNTDLLVKGKFTAGTISPTEARVNLKLNGVSLNSSGVTVIPSIQKAGDYGFNVVGAVYGVMLIEPGVGYLTFGVQNSTNASLNKVNGTVIGTSTITTLDARVPIAGWEANTNAAIAGCVDAKSCTDTLSAQLSSTGVVSGENVDWINGNCSFASGVADCTLVTSLATVPLNCTVSQSNLGNADVYNYQLGASTSSLARFTNQTNANNRALSVTCQKSGADFKPKTVVVSPLQGYVKVPGAENLNVESFKVSYGAAVTTICSVNGACAYKNELGTSGTLAVANISRTSTGNYTLNTTKTYSSLKCTASVSNPGVFLQIRGGSCTSCSSLSFISGYDVTAYDSYGTLDCTGVF